MKLIIECLIITLLSLNHHFALANEIDSILDRHKRFLLQDTPTEERAKQLIQHFDQESGQWSNIDYANNNLAEWRIINHLKNTRELAIYWVGLKDGASKKKLFSLIIAALDNWCSHQYRSKNWWYNEINVPQVMKDILVLIHQKLSPPQLSKYLDIVGQFKINGKGANLIWSAEIGLFYGLFTRDFKLVNHAYSSIIDEIRITTGEGLQPDYSFHQHGARLQMFHYGKIFLQDNIRLAWELKLSQWAYPEDKILLLCDMLLDGWQWMSRGVNTVPETMDRASSRVGALKLAEIRRYIPYFMETLPSHKKEFLKIWNSQNANTQSVCGFKGYPFSDFAAFHSRPFSFFIKTISTRTLLSESINGENLKGNLLNSGETYFIRDGTEYFNLMPVWDWNKLPGITTFDGASKVIRNRFSGVVANNKLGIISMKYKIADSSETRSISCRKSWFVFDDGMLCLMSDIKFENLKEASTILNQCRLKGEVFAEKMKVPIGKDLTITRKWLFHDNFIYAPLYPNTPIHLFADTLSGDWYSINHSNEKGKITETVFMPSIFHNGQVSQSGYFISYSEDSKATTGLSFRSKFRILRNDKACQAIVVNNHLLMATFYQGGEITFQQQTLQVDTGCMVLADKNKVFISDPTHEGRIIKGVLNGKRFNIKLPSDGSTRVLMIH